MPAATVASSSSKPANSGGGGQVPFLIGSNQYSEKMPSTVHQIEPGESREVVQNITPGGFLRGVTLYVRSRGGVLGSGSITQDNPWCLLSDISLDNVDGSHIKYPMSGYAYYLENKWCKPWLGDPSTYPNGFDRGINPKFELRIWPEIRDTAGVLANTDARSQYRIRYTIAAGRDIAYGAVSKWPTVEVTPVIETWAQTDTADLHGTSIAPLPRGLAIGSILRHDVKDLHAANADNILGLNNTGNEFRCTILVVRDADGIRRDYLGDPVRFRLDDRSVWVRSTDSIVSQMYRQYPALAAGTSTREEGVYVIPNFRNPGSLNGEYWRPTSNATFVMLEVPTAAHAKNLPGTVEIITDEVVPVGPVPAELEGC